MEKALTMSFGGSTLGAILSLKANRALKRGRNSLFDREVVYDTEGEWEAPVADAATRAKFRRKLEAEKSADRRNWLLTFAASAVVLTGLYYWWF